MKTEIIKVDGTKEPLENLDLNTLQKAVDGYIEIVTLENGMMIVDEEGRVKEKPANITASIMAQKTIVGDVVVLSEKDTLKMMKE